MVYGIIKQTGGFIYCDSEVGKGTVFRIFLPRHIAGSQPAARRPTREASAAAPDATPLRPRPAGAPRDLSGSATVLLVEDEDAVRMGGMRALTSRGYTVHEASSGVEALEIFHELEGKIDIVVSDVVMPEMDGPTLLGELRKLQPDIKFIFVSGYAEDAFAKNLPADAKFGFLPKPFSLKQLATLVKEVLESLSAGLAGCVLRGSPFGLAPQDEEVGVTLPRPEIGGQRASESSGLVGLLAPTSAQPEERACQPTPKRAPAVALTSSTCFTSRVHCTLPGGWMKPSFAACLVRAFASPLRPCMRRRGFGPSTISRPTKSGRPMALLPTRRGSTMSGWLR